MPDEEKPGADRFDYECLAGDLDAACSTETGQEAEAKRNEAGSRLRDFLWKARIDAGIIASVNPKPDRLAEATLRWALLYRLVHSRRWELQPEEDTRRQAILEKIADEAGLPNLPLQLHEFMQDIGHAILVSPDPVKKLARILTGTAKRGPKEKAFEQRIEIAAAVEKLRSEGMTLENACEKVTETTRPRIGKDAVRRIYENATKGNGPLVRQVAAGKVGF
jgi:hypothetical protein